MPPVTTLVKSGSEGSSASLAQRLSVRCSHSVALAWNLPEEPPALGLAAERLLLQHLQMLDLVRDSQKLNLQ
jgi:hypothetical protein